MATDHFRHIPCWSELEGYENYISDSNTGPFYPESILHWNGQWVVDMFRLFASGFVSLSVPKTAKKLAAADDGFWGSVPTWFPNLASMVYLVPWHRLTHLRWGPAVEGQMEIAGNWCCGNPKSSFFAVAKRWRWSKLKTPQRGFSMNPSLHLPRGPAATTGFSTWR